jgi:hypothetical protein
MWGAALFRSPEVVVTTERAIGLVVGLVVFLILIFVLLKIAGMAF